MSDVRASAQNARQALDRCVNMSRSRFDEESAGLRNQSAPAVRELVLNRLEKIQMEYGRSLKDIRVIKHEARMPMLKLEIWNISREQVTRDGWTPTSPELADDYITQTAVGIRLRRAPLKEVDVGSYWSMGGSNQHLLTQEYEDHRLTLMDQFGANSVFIPWDNDRIVSTTIIHLSVSLLDLDP